MDEPRRLRAGLPALAPAPCPAAGPLRRSGFLPGPGWGQGRCWGLRLSPGLLQSPVASAALDFSNPGCALFRWLSRYQILLVPPFLERPLGEPQSVTCITAEPLVSIAQQRRKRLRGGDVTYPRSYRWEVTVSTFKRSADYRVVNVLLKVAASRAVPTGREARGSRLLPPTQLEDQAAGFGMLGSPKPSRARGTFHIMFI